MLEFVPGGALSGWIVEEMRCPRIVGGDNHWSEDERNREPVLSM
jgi:hypothetical protein